MKNILLASFFAIVFAAGAAVPTIDAVSFAQDPATRRVTVTYKLTGADGIITADVLTNLVSIGAANFRNVYGDVNRRITADAEAVRTIWWAPDNDWPGHVVSNGTLSVKLAAWSMSAPPPYMAICLAVTNAPIHYYASEEAVPDGVTATKYMTDWLLMRKIGAAGKTWRMGTPAYETGRKVREVLHYVTLTNDYYLGVYPVTQSQYYLIYKGLGATAAMNTNRPFVWQGKPDSDLRPAENMSWEDLRGNGKGDTTAYTWPLKGHAVNPSYLLGRMRACWSVEFDLPTEAQWEYACRAGCGDAAYVWNANVADLAWTTNNSGVVENGVLVAQTHPVGLKKPNAFGLYDMLGNVQEWVLDMTGTNMPYNADGSPIREPTGTATGTGNRLRKGCSFLNTTAETRSSMSYDNWSQAAHNQIIGFRLCCPATLN